MDKIGFSRLNSFKRAAVMATVALISHWSVPVLAEISVNNKTAVSSIDAKNQRFFTQQIGILQDIKGLDDSGLDIEQYIIKSSDSDIAKRYQKLGIVFEFATVQGNIHGRAGGKILAEVAADGEQSFTLSLPSVIEASPIDMPGMKINNYGTPIKLARLATLSRVDDTTERVLSGSGAVFLDSNTDTVIAYVYSSGKVDISGEQTVGKDVYRFRVSLPAQGWHWITYNKVGNVITMTRVDSSTVSPVIAAI